MPVTSPGMAPLQTLSVSIEHQGKLVARRTGYSQVSLLTLAVTAEPTRADPVTCTAGTYL
jgi:hypothetical protein